MSDGVEAMIDIELLGTRPGSAILSVGAVCFAPRRPWDILAGEPEAAARFLGKATLESSFEAGLAADAGALRFWMRQGDEARLEAFSGETHLRDVLAGLSDWFRDSGATKVWAHGATFDPVLLSVAYRKFGMEPPWDFRAVRDTRTVFDLAGIEYSGRGHRALGDCLAQAEKVCEAFGILGLHAPAGTPL